MNCTQVQLAFCRLAAFLAIAFIRVAARCTVAIFSGRFMPRHLRISSRVRPQLTHSSLLSWHNETQGLSMSLAMQLLSQAALHAHVRLRCGTPGALPRP